jgi:hypothetical protein
MSTVSSILDAVDVRVKAVLPSAYNRLKYSYELEKNDKRTQAKGYGTGVGAGETVSGTNKSATIDQTFFVVITGEYANRNNDTAERTLLGNIYGDLELVYKDLFQSKAGLGSIILVVSGFSIEEPIILADGVLSVRMNFIIKYREQT